MTVPGGCSGWPASGRSVRIMAVRDHLGEPISAAEPPLCLGEQHHPSVGGDPSAIEGGANLSMCNRRKVEGQQGIFVHRNSPKSAGAFLPWPRTAQHAKS